MSKETEILQRLTALEVKVKGLIWLVAVIGVIFISSILKSLIAGG